MLLIFSRPVVGDVEDAMVWSPGGATVWLADVVGWVAVVGSDIVGMLWSTCEISFEVVLGSR